MTEHVSTDTELQASELRYRRLFEAARDGILILDGNSGQIVDVNPYLCELMGYGRADFLGHRLWEIGPFKNIAAAKDSFAELQTTGYLRFDDLPLEAQDGRMIAAEFVSNVYDVDGSRVIQCNIRDMTERHADHKMLRILGSAFDAVSQGIVITDALADDNPIIYVSPGFQRMFGYAEAEVIGRNCRFLQGPATEALPVAEIRDAVANARPYNAELLNYRQDGTTLWNRLVISPIVDADGRLIHFVGVQMDVTERRQLEGQFAQAQKMEAVGRLAGGIAHDFNNVLSVIASYADLLLDDFKSNALAAADIVEIKKAALRATRLTQQLLAFSRQQVLEIRALDLSNSVVAMDSMLRRLLGADVTLTVVTAPRPSMINADPGQIEQILMNLAVNARDAMPLGGELTVETGNLELDSEYTRAHHDVVPGPYVLLSVTDTGTGMDDATLKRIFEPFFTTKEQGKGTGLGLATVFGIVKQSGGHIGVDSSPDKGTCFRLYFPMSTGTASAPAVDQAAAEIAAAHETILLVEDDDQVRTVAETILRRAGYSVLVASNGGEAFLICEKQGGTIHLLLTDVVLPRMSGRTLAERLIELRPAMKVLFMSGYTNDVVLQPGIIGSELNYLQKPITPVSLTQKVRDVLNQTTATQKPAC